VSVRLRLHLPLLGACLLLALGIWVNTGTLAPYGATLEKPLLWGPCNYPLNIDHFHFKATFLMLDGAPRGQWEFSVVLRRVLYPLLAYPFMKLLGYGAGGLITNVLLAVGSLAVFWLALRRRLGRLGEEEPPPALLALLATYPGWMYWAGLPYSYAAIVPLCLLCMVLLWQVETLTGWRQALVTGLALGVLFTGYDLLPFFGAAGVLLLLRRRLWGPCAVFTVAQLIPTALTAAVLWKVFRVPFRNGNTEAYFAVLKSYVSPVDLWKWWYWLRQFPQAVVANVFFSNFLFLPLLFLFALLAARWLPRESRAVLRPAEAWLLIAAALLFLFNNLAPPYPGWPLRGAWVPRLYQPVFVALITTLAVFYARAPLLPRTLRRGAWAALGLAVALQAWVVFAPVLGAPRLSGWLYYRFYQHSKRPYYADNLQKLGARPVGFCASPPISPESMTH
jgi:hypothetical protein